ncbi:YggT family protein [Crenobacter luteus]|uniref:Osmotic-shock protein n=1 Tax=Crenobacter luteus TaxID=1452487 RepID=A0A163BTH8_9NEIS|nr:YggT family protein [Crenobacter luteus]KZE28902.1 osmotic-shock protein [Crenobacter luteus]TCP11395.1 YggT family protein [Crenobacter luteus]
MIYQTLEFVIRMLAELFALVLLLRFYLQVARAPFRHPLAQFSMALTNFVVLKARRLIPSVRSYDTATLAVAWAVLLLSKAASLLLNPVVSYDLVAPQTWLALALLAVLDLFKLSLYLLMGAVLVQAVLSWVNPYNPLTPVLDALTRPYLRPFGRARVGGVDLSPLILILIIQVILSAPLPYLEWGLLSQLKPAL